MNYAIVKFKNSYKKYTYKTRLSLIPGATYQICNDKGYDYSGAEVTVLELISKPPYAGDLREIVAAKCMSAPEAALPYSIKNVYENFADRITTVVWDDGTVTMVTCSHDDDWDREKAIYAAFIKKHYGNRGRFNDDVQKWCRVLRERRSKQLSK